MFDINPHPFLGADECIGDYMVWLIPYMFLLKVPEHDMTISDLQTAPQFFGFVFGPDVFRQLLLFTLLFSSELFSLLGFFSPVPPQFAVNLTFGQKCLY
jgi:hypothetical protein